MRKNEQEGEIRKLFFTVWLDVGAKAVWQDGVATAGGTDGKAPVFLV